MLAPEPTVHLLDSGCRLVSWNNIVIVDFLDLPTPESVVAFRKAIGHAAEEHELATVIVRVRAPMKIPPSDIRTQLTTLLRDSGPITRGWCVAVEGDGFWAAAHRSFSASMHLLSGSKTRMKIFATIDQAAALAATLTDRSQSQIESVIARMERLAS